MIPNLEVALLNIQDVKLAVVFLRDAADSPHVAHAAVYTALAQAASEAGLEGELVVVWPDASGRTRFLARPQRHAFLRAVDYDQLRAQINTTLRASLS